MKTSPLNDFGRIVTVEECQKVTIHELIRKSNEFLKEALIKSQIQTLTTTVCLATSLTYRGGVRYWFSCPQCTKRVGVLFTHPITGEMGCRKCLNLKYWKSRFKGMIEGE